MRRLRRQRLRGGFGGAIHARGIALWSAALSVGIFCVWEHVYSATLASDIEALRAERADTMAEIGFLGMKCTELSSRERVEEYATVRLAMRYPTGDEIVWLRPDGRLVTDAPYEARVKERINAATQG
jgi:cell division protein FtsL